MSYRWILNRILLGRISIKRGNKLGSINSIFKLHNLCCLGDISIAFLNIIDEFNCAIIIVGLQLILRASEFVDADVVVHLHIAIRTGNICVKHKDHVQSTRVDLFSLWVPEHARVVGLALLQGTVNEAGDQ
jgi:hypothetical protein